MTSAPVSHGENRDRGAPGSTVARACIALLAARIRGALHGVSRSSRTGRVRGMLAVVLASSVLVGFHYGTFFILSFIQARAPTPLAEVMAERMLDVVILLQVFVVGFSGLLMSMAHLFASDDVPYLAAQPVPPMAIFILKWLEVAVAVGWMPFLVAAGVFSGIARFTNVIPQFALWGPVALLLCLLVPTAIAVGLACLTASVFRLYRPRNTLGLVVTAVVFVMGFLAWRLEPQRLLHMDSVETLAEAIAHLRLSANTHLPAWAARQLLVPLLRGQPVTVTAILAAAAWLVGAAIVGFVLFQRFFRSALGRALESQQGSSRPTLKRAQSLWNVLERVMPREEAAIIRKDILQFVRDPSQWTQALFLSSVLFIYLVTIHGLPHNAVDHLGLPAWQLTGLLAYANLVISSLVLSAVALRFVYTSVSLEGRAAWIVMSCPLQARRILGAKLALGFVVLGGVGLPLVIASNFLLGANWGATAATALGMVLTTRALSGLAVGLGGLMPNFLASHPMKVSSGLGGLIYSISAITYVVVLALMLFAPIVWAISFAAGHGSAGGPGLLRAILGLSLAILLTVAVGWLPPRLAATRMSRGLP